MNILVTGGAGFIGSHLVDELVELGHNVLIIDNFSTGQYRNVNARYEVVNILATEDVDRHVSDFQPVLAYHLAAETSVVRSMRNPSIDALTNVVGTVNVLNALAKTRSCARVVFTSTGGVMYGECAVPATEETPPQPANPYAVGKLSAEQYVHYFARVYGFDATIFRLANVYGPRQDPNGEAGVVAIFTKAIRKGKPCKIYGDGNTIRDYIYVTDVVRALVHQLDLSSPSGLFNIGSGEGTTVNTIFYTLTYHTASPVGEQTFPARDEVRRSILNAKKAEKLLHWKPDYTVEVGLRTYLE